jgi:hypothetical protein
MDPKTLFEIISEEQKVLGVLHCNPKDFDSSNSDDE